MTAASVFHLGLRHADLHGAELALLPGDPARVPRILSGLEHGRLLASHREFTSGLGKLDGQPLVVCSTGIGGPSTSIAVEELAQLGVRTFLRIGTTGAIQPQIRVGDLLITTAAVRLDGASRHYAPLAFPAVADFDCTRALVDAARQSGLPIHVGISASSDTFYPGQERYDTFSGRVIPSLRGSLQEWQALGVLNFEMESATLLTMCASQGLRAAMLSAVIVNRCQQERPAAQRVAQAEANAIALALAGARHLLSRPRPAITTLT